MKSQPLTSPLQEPPKAIIRRVRDLKPNWVVLYDSNIFKVLSKNETEIVLVSEQYNKRILGAKSKQLIEVVSGIYKLKA